MLLDSAHITCEASVFGFYNSPNNIADLEGSFKSTVFAHVAEIAKNVDAAVRNPGRIQALRILLLGTFKVKVGFGNTYAIDVQLPFYQLDDFSRESYNTHNQHIGRALVCHHVASFYR